MNLYAETVTDRARTVDLKVTDKDVAYVAELASLDLTSDERARMLRDLNSILEYVDRLRGLDTENVEPMAQVSDRYGVDVSRAKGASALPTHLRGKT